MPIEVKFHVDPSWDGGMIVCSNDPDHMTKMAAMPMYGKNMKFFFFATKRLMILKVDMQHRVLDY